MPNDGCGVNLCTISRNRSYKNQLENQLFHTIVAFMVIYLSESTLYKKTRPKHQDFAKASCMLPRINQFVGYAREQEERRSQRARWQNNDHREASQERVHMCVYVCAHYFERERERENHATRHTGSTSSITWPTTRRSRKAARVTSGCARARTYVQSVFKRE